MDANDSVVFWRIHVFSYYVLILAFNTNMTDKPFVLALMDSFAEDS